MSFLGAFITLIDEYHEWKTNACLRRMLNLTIRLGRINNYIRKHQYFDIPSGRHEFDTINLNFYYALYIKLLCEISMTINNEFKTKPHYNKLSHSNLFSKKE